ncbi:MAG TPA: UDP-2,3-diacylglucosamine diphosphatase [Anaerolineae bacterium]|nr:UDP-2,3-diacylglucosamine diphosphatase [Anaerolineae bacterium]
MDKRKKLLPDRIAFMADAHLGMPGDDQSRIEKVASFIRWLRGQVSHLYIVGDLFDFWFEYTSVVPNVAPHVVFELYNLIQSGTKVTLFGGNHDYWLGPYLRDSVGLNVVHDTLVVEHQGQKIYLHHGDGLYPNDRGYRILKKVVRNSITIFLFKLLHPDCAKHIAALTSRASRSYLSPSPEKKDLCVKLFRDIADKRLKEGFNALIFGHTHIPLIEHRCHGSLILLGDWINQETYVLLENGEFTLHNWNEYNPDQL